MSCPTLIAECKERGLIGEKSLTPTAAVTGAAVEEVTVGLAVADVERAFVAATDKTLTLSESPTAVKLGLLLLLLPHEEPEFTSRGLCLSVDSASPVCVSHRRTVPSRLELANAILPPLLSRMTLTSLIVLV